MTKLCVKDGVWHRDLLKSCVKDGVCVCVTKLSVRERWCVCVCDKVVCDKVVCVCEKDGV